MVIPVLFLIVLVFLIAEVRQINLLRKRIPCVIAVGGTRGKTSLVRMIASILQENGSRVLAKTTGSAAAYILPGGMVEPIKRSGPASVLEQKKILKKAAELHAEYLVTETMSFTPEVLTAELQKILMPDIYIITNARTDHTDSQGTSEDTVAASLVRSMPEQSTIVITESEYVQHFSDCGITNSLKISRHKNYKGFSYIPFGTGLARTVGELLKIPRDTVISGIKKAGDDIGAVKIWQNETSAGSIYYVNCFAANDPFSTREIMNYIIEKHFPQKSLSIAGLLCLRTDRADRTGLWIRSLNEGKFDHLNKIFVVGGHSGAFLRKTINKDKVIPFRKCVPGSIMETIEKTSGRNTVVFGMGNIHGPGLEFIQYWENNLHEYPV